MTQILILAFLLACGEACISGRGRTSQRGMYIVVLKPKSVRSAGIRNPDNRWEGRTIPYEVDTGFPENNLVMLLKVMKHFEGRTCIRFRRRSNQADFLNITHRYYWNSCHSPVGKRGGAQTFSVKDYCASTFSMIHELMHAIGFYHEHQRTDRDEFVTIKWENVDDRMNLNFEELNGSVISPFGVPYDYQSIVHYFRNQGSKNNTNDTISQLNPDFSLGPTHYQLSPYDIMKINNMFCHGTIAFRIQSVAHENLVLTVKKINETMWKVKTLDWADEEDQKFTVDWYALQDPSKGSYIVPWKQHSTNVIVLKEPTDRVNDFVQGSWEEANSFSQLWYVERTEGANDSMWQIVNRQSGRCISKAQDTEIPKAVMAYCSYTDTNQFWRMYKV